MSKTPQHGVRYSRMRRALFSPTLQIFRRLISLILSIKSPKNGAPLSIIEIYVSTLESLKAWGITLKF